jgi:hypothetical protein
MINRDSRGHQCKFLSQFTIFTGYPTIFIGDPSIFLLGGSHKFLFGGTLSKKYLGAH